MDQFLAEAKRLVQRLQNHDNAVDILISETTNLQNKLISMRQYRDEVNQMNQAADHRPRSTLILGSQLENQRIQNLEQENRELSISLAEHQSALELIMNKYREQVLVMMKANGTHNVLSAEMSQPTRAEIMMSEKIVEMACVMRQSASIDESVAAKEIETLRSLELENANLRELLEISGKDFSIFVNNESPSMPNTIPTKDSGFCERESTTENVEKLSYKPIRIKSKSKPANTLQNLFANQVSKTYNEHSDERDNNMKDDSYQLYTIEKFIPPNDVDSKSKIVNEEINGQLENGDFLDIFRKNLKEDNDLFAPEVNANPSSFDPLTKNNVDIFSDIESPVDKENDTGIQKSDINNERDDTSTDSSYLMNEDTDETDEHLSARLKKANSNSDSEASKNSYISTDNTSEENHNDALKFLDDAIDFNFDEETDFIFHKHESIDNVLHEDGSFQENYDSNHVKDYEQSKDAGEFSDASSECSDVTVIDFSLEKTLTDNEEEALLADMDSFLDDQFDMEHDDDNDTNG